MKNHVDLRRTPEGPASPLLLCLLVLNLLGGVFVWGTGKAVRAESAEDYYGSSAEQYVEAEYEDTEFGTRTIPRINFDALGPNVAAEDFEAQIEAIIREQDANIELTRRQYESEGWDSSDFWQVSLMTAVWDMKDDVLSVAVSYTPFAPNELLRYRYLSLNVDVQTGHKLSYEELLSLAGFSEANVDFSIRALGEARLSKDVAHMVLYQAADEGRVPEPDEFMVDWPQWEGALADCVDGFHASLEGREDFTGQIPDPPAYYLDCQGWFSVSAPIPMMAGAGYQMKMVPVVKTRDELHIQALLDCFYNPLLGNDFVTPEAALDAAIRSFELDEEGNTEEGVHLSFALDSMAIIWVWEDETEPAYVVEAFEDRGDHKSNYGWRYVTALSGSVMNYDVVSDSYDYVEGNLASYDGDFLMDGRERGALAVILRDVGPYDEYLYGPHYTADLGDLLQVDPASYDNGKTRMCMVSAMDPDALIQVEYGNSSGEWGVMDRVLYEATLQLGETLFVKYSAADANDVGVRVLSGGGECFYNLGELEGEPETIVYLMAE